MRRGIISFCIGLVVAGANCIALAQDASTPGLMKGIVPLDSGSGVNSSGLSDDKTADSQASGVKTQSKGGDVTEITATTGATFDQQTRQAVFTGDVHVKNPQFTLTTDKLTAILKKEMTQSHAAGTPAPDASRKGPAPTPDASGKNPALSTGGGLEKVIAEGNVVIVQEKPATDGTSAPVRYVAKSERAEYESASGNVTLTGWPQVQQGINTQVATEASTMMVLNRNGQMHTSGGSKTLIQDTGTTTNTHP